MSQPTDNNEPGARGLVPAGTIGAGPGSRLDTPILCLGFGLGNAGSSSQAVWVAAAVTSGLLAPATVGTVASAELLLIAAVALLAARWMRAVAPRYMLAGAGLLIASGNLAATVGSSLALFVAGRLLSGLGMGILLAVVTAMSARRSDAQRVLTFMQGTVLVVGIAIFATAPYLTRTGPGGVFALLGVLGVIIALLAFAGLPAKAAGGAEGRHGASRMLRLPPLLVGLGIGCVSAGTAMVGTYFLLIAQWLGFRANDVAQMLAIALPLSILGPVTAHFLGERLGLVWPLLIALVLIVADMMLMVHAPTMAMFGATMVALLALGMFYPPFALAVAARLDMSGRAAGVGVAFLTFGAALAPKLGSLFVAHGQATWLAGVAASLVVGGGVLITIAWLTAQRSSEGRCMADRQAAA